MTPTATDADNTHYKSCNPFDYPLIGSMSSRSIVQIFPTENEIIAFPLQVNTDANLDNHTAVQIFSTASGANESDLMNNANLNSDQTWDTISIDIKEEKVESNEIKGNCSTLLKGCAKVCCCLCTLGIFAGAGILIWQGYVHGWWKEDGNGDCDKSHHHFICIFY
jgi:hypothetical protein